MSAEFPSTFDVQDAAAARRLPGLLAALGALLAALVLAPLLPLRQGLSRVAVALVLSAAIALVLLVLTAALRPLLADLDSRPYGRRR